MNQPPAGIQISEQGNVAYMPSIGAVVTMRGLPYLPDRTPPEAAATATTPILRPELTPGYDDVVSWGEDNNFPGMIRDLIKRSTIIPRSLQDIAAFWIGGGLVATVDENSEELIDDQEIRDFLNSRSTKRYWIKIAKSMATWWNCFPEFILSKDRSKIVQLHCIETSFCRWGRMDPKTGQLNKVYVNANWPNATSTDPETIRLTAVNPLRYDLVDWVRDHKEYKFVYPVSFPTEGNVYYQLAAWDAARSSGWLDVLNAIPQFKKAAMTNQMSLRYHIEVDDEYWTRVYGDTFESADYEGRMAIRNAFLASLMERLTNVQNANKGILTDKWRNTDGKEAGITIHVLDDKHKEGKYNEDYSDGVANLLYSIGVDPTLFGFASGKEGGRSGGSDKREAFLIFIIKSKPFRDLLLEPLQFVAEYNGWTKRYPKMNFKFRDTLLTTLDTGKSTTTVVNPAA